MDIDASWAWLAVGSISLLWIFLLMVAERFVLVMPSYAVLLVAGATAAQRPGGLLLTFIVTLLGSMLAGWLWYLIGQRVGARRTASFLTRRGGWVGMREASYQRLSRGLEKRAKLSTMVAQWIPGLRIFATFPAGVIGIKPLAIAPAFLLGASGWNLALLLVGWGFGSAGLAAPWQLILASAGILAVELALIGITLLIRRVYLSRMRTQGANRSTADLQTDCDGRSAA